MTKNLDNTNQSDTAKTTSDLAVFGNTDVWKLICKASSSSEGWMKSTKAMEIPGIGCVVQVTTQQGDNIAEALTFVQDVQIEETKDKSGIVTSRKIVGY